ncbi:MAG: hypothetical protein AAB368_04525, partial [bacterium]
YEWYATSLNMTPGTAQTFEIRGNVGLVCAPETATNQATAAAVDVCGSAYTVSAPATSFTVDPPTAGLTIVKSHLPASPNPAGTVTYSIVVTNTGTDTLTSLTVSDTLPAILAYNVGSQTNTAGLPFNITGQVASWTGAVTVNPGTSHTFTVDATVGCGSGAVNNDAWANAAVSCGAIQAKTAVADTFTIFTPVLSTSVTKIQAPLAPGIGEGVQYTITVQNTGGATIQNLTVTDTISPVVVGVTPGQPVGFGAPLVVSVPGTGTRYEWYATGVNFLPGTTRTFTLSGFVGAVCGVTTVTNRALDTAVDSCGSAYTLSGPATSFTVAPHVTSLSVVKTQSSASNPPGTSPANLNIGDTVTYDIVVTNTGSATITTLTVSDTVAALMTVAGTV